MAAASSRRRAGTRGGVRLAGRAWADSAPELQAWTELKDAQAAGGLPAGFNSVVAAVLALGVESTAGTESSGWAGADHIHKLDLGLSSPGDILAFDSTGYVAIPQGAAVDGYVLTRDVASPGRAKWAAAGSGSFELVDGHDFVAPATSLTFSGLDGDTDEVWYLAFRIIKAVAAAMTVDLRPNGATTNQATEGRSDGTGGGSTFASGTTMRIMNHGAAHVGDLSVGSVWFDAKTGTYRTFRGQWSDLVSTSDFANNIATALWDEKVTNITSLDIVANQVNGIGIGSYVRLYRLKH